MKMTMAELKRTLAFIGEEWGPGDDLMPEKPSVYIMDECCTPAQAREVAAYLVELAATAEGMARFSAGRVAA